MIVQSTPDTTRAWVEVDLGAVRENAATAARRAGARLLPMIKADAYGLGAVPVARALESLDPWGYGVASVREGEELRAAGIRRPILVVTPLLVDDFPAARAASLTPALGNPESIAHWSAGGNDPWHLAIDTGMNRAGLSWRDVARVREVIDATPPEGAFTHFHSSELADGSREEQERRFVSAIDQLPQRPRLLHASNSAAIARALIGKWDLCRPGVFLYGVGSNPGAEVEPRPVASLRARIVEIRTVPAGDTVSYDATWTASSERRIATIACGYADGYRRILSGRATALVSGRRVPVAGIVTMDMTMFDVTDVPCAVGDVVTLIGQDGDETLLVEDVARTAEMSPYELLTGLKLRVPRLYQGA